MSSNGSYSDYQNSVSGFDYEDNTITNLPQNLNFTMDEIRQQLYSFGYTDIPDDKLLIIKKDLDEIIAKDESLKGRVRNDQNQYLSDRRQNLETNSEFDNNCSSIETLSSNLPSSFKKMKRKTNRKNEEWECEQSTARTDDSLSQTGLQDENCFRKVSFPTNPVDDIFNYTGAVSTIDPRNDFPQSSYMESTKKPPSKTNGFIRTNDHKIDSGWHRHDPVSRYHSYKVAWELNKAPGESPHKQLRWAVKEALMVREVPRPRPVSRVQSARTHAGYQPPGQNKRNDVRWQVRQELANPDVYFD